MLNDEELRAEVATIIMGGFETTAHSLAFTLLCIATDKPTEAAIVEEMQQLGVFSEHGTRRRDLTYNDTKQMRNTTNAIKEAMRMFPVVVGIPRQDFQANKIMAMNCPCFLNPCFRSELLTHCIRYMRLEQKNSSSS